MNFYSFIHISSRQLQSFWIIEIPKLAIFSYDIYDRWFREFWTPYLDMLRMRLCGTIVLLKAIRIIRPGRYVEPFQPV